MKYDVLIVGGGTAGVACAVSYAQAGFKVAIIEKQISLGGTQTNGLVTPFMPSKVAESIITDKILSNYEKYEKNTNMTKFESAYSFNPETFQYALDQLMEELNVDIYYDTICTEVIIDGKTIKSIGCLNAFTKLVLSADIFVDTTANLQLGLLAGLKSQEDNETKQAVSLRFEISNIDLIGLKQFLENVDYRFGQLDQEYLEFVYVPENQLCSGLTPYINQGLEAKIITSEDARYIQAFTTPSTTGLLSFNGPQLPNLFDVHEPLQYSKAIIEGRKMQQRLHKFLQLYIPGFENSYISKSANMLGIRESVRLKGMTTPSGIDYINRNKCVDSVAKGDWYIDIHSDDTCVESDSFKMKYDDHEYYDIPYGALVTKELDNYICNGRHISTSFEMQSSTRIQYTIYMIAEKLGDIYAFCIKNKVKINDVEAIKEGYYENK